MTQEVIDVKTGEVVVEEKLALVRSNGMESLVKAQDLPLLAVMETLDSLDWRALKPHHTAMLLMQKPFPASGGGTMYLSFKQAILFATRCYELGVSPFSSEVWYDPNKGTTQLTLEGKRTVARNKGIDLGPPRFENLERNWDSVPRLSDNAKEAQKLFPKNDIGIKCSIRVGDPKIAEHSEYTAWLSEWMVPRSPVWQSKPIHMLQTRATEKSISLALGTGASESVE